MSGSMHSATHTIRRVAGACGLRLADIRSERRQAPLVYARKACALALRRAGYSFEEIGEAMRRVHSTMVEAVQHPEHGALVLAERDPVFAAAVAAGAK